MYWYLSHQVGLCELLFWESAMPIKRVETTTTSRIDRRALRKRAIGFLLHLRVRRAPRKPDCEQIPGSPDRRSYNIGVVTCDGRRPEDFPNSPAVAGI